MVGNWTKGRGRGRGKGETPALIEPTSSAPSVFEYQLIVGKKGAKLKIDGHGCQFWLTCNQNHSGCLAIDWSFRQWRISGWRRAKLEIDHASNNINNRLLSSRVDGCGPNGSTSIVTATRNWWSIMEFEADGLFAWPPPGRHCHFDRRTHIHEMKEMGKITTTTTTTTMTLNQTKLINVILDLKEGGEAKNCLWPDGNVKNGCGGKVTLLRNAIIYVDTVT